MLFRSRSSALTSAPRALGADPGGIGRARERTGFLEESHAQLVEVGGRLPEVVEERLGRGRAGSDLGGGCGGARPDLREPGTQGRESLPQVIQTSGGWRHVGGRSSIADGPRDNRVAVRID